MLCLLVKIVILFNVILGERKFWLPEMTFEPKDLSYDNTGFSIFHFSTKNNQIGFIRNSKFILLSLSNGRYLETEVSPKKEIPVFISDRFYYEGELLQMICYDTIDDVYENNLDCEFINRPSDESLKKIVLQLFDYKKIAFISRLVKTGKLYWIDIGDENNSIKIYAGYQSKNNQLENDWDFDEPILLIHKYPKQFAKNFTESPYSWHTKLGQKSAFKTNNKFHSLFKSPFETHAYVVFTENEFDQVNNRKMARIGRVCLNDPGTKSSLMQIKNFDELLVSFRKISLICRVNDPNYRGGREILLNKILTISDLIKTSNDYFMYAIMSTDYSDQITNHVGVCIFSLYSIERAFQEERHYVEPEKNKLDLSDDLLSSSYFNSILSRPDLYLPKIQKFNTVTKRLRDFVNECSIEPLDQLLSTYSIKNSFLISFALAKNGNQGESLFNFNYLSDMIEISKSKKLAFIEASAVSIKEYNFCYNTTQDLIFIGLNTGHVQVIQSSCKIAECPHIGSDQNDSTDMKYLARLIGLEEEIVKIFLACSTITETGDHLHMTLMGQNSIRQFDFNQNYCKNLKNCHLCEKSKVVPCQWNGYNCSPRDANKLRSSYCVTTIESSMSKGNSESLTEKGMDENVRNWIIIGFCYVFVIVLSCLIGYIVGRKRIIKSPMKRLVFMSNNAKKINDSNTPEYLMNNYFEHDKNIARHLGNFMNPVILNNNHSPRQLKSSYYNAEILYPRNSHVETLINNQFGNPTSSLSYSNLSCSTVKNRYAVENNERAPSASHSNFYPTLLSNRWDSMPVRKFFQRPSSIDKNFNDQIYL